MSSDSRLDRLGLSHLADRPKELRAELERRVKEDKRTEQRIAREMEAHRKKLGLSATALPEEKADTGVIGRGRRPRPGLRPKR
jgi:hypothetical protein